ncbi:MAG: SDR family oxidoreductase [Actinomycetota bacterium]|nr:SDR family oxidoreductase [Actinomycetota bacterium]
MDIPEWLDLSGRVAIVTGSGSASGIGMATARALGELGAAAVISATGDHIHDRVAELRGEGLDAHGVPVDLTSMSGARSVVEFAAANMGVPTILVNNAGMTHQGAVVESGSAVDISEEQWHRGLQRNLDTGFFMTKAAIPYMREQRFGRIVFVSSVTGPLMAMRGEAAYAAAKAGMVGLMRSIAIDEAPNGITANAVAPGWIATGAQTDGEASEGLGVPIGRSADPAEVAVGIAMLCAPGAGYITGQIIAIDGGNSIDEERGNR